MRGVLTELNGRVWNFLSGIRLSELAGTPGVRETLLPGFIPAHTASTAALSRRIGDEP